MPIISAVSSPFSTMPTASQPATGSGFSGVLNGGAVSAMNADIAAQSNANQQMLAFQNQQNQYQQLYGTQPGSSLAQAYGSPNLTGAASNAGSFNSDIAQMSAENMKMMQVQMAMQRENQVFTSVSNVLKTKHDTVKNSISNIR